MYIYPENLTAKPMMWLWQLKDIATAGILALVGVILAVQFKFSLLLVISAAYAFLTIRVEDVSIMDYIKHTAKFVLTPQFYLWEDSIEKIK